MKNLYSSSLLKWRKDIAMIKLLPQTSGNLIAVEVTGTVSHDEYNTFEAKFQQMVKEHGKVRIYADATGFQGASWSTIWDDLKNMSYYRDVAKFAIVGNKTWEEWVAKATSLFISGELKFFHTGHEQEALAWVMQ